MRSDNCEIAAKQVCPSRSSIATSLRSGSHFASLTRRGRGSELGSRRGSRRLARRKAGAPWAGDDAGDEGRVAESSARRRSRRPGNTWRSVGTCVVTCARGTTSSPRPLAVCNERGGSIPSATPTPGVDLRGGQPPRPGSRPPGRPPPPGGLRGDQDRAPRCRTGASVIRPERGKPQRSSEADRTVQVLASRGRGRRAIHRS